MMRRITVIVAVALVMAAMIAVSAPSAFAKSTGYGWGAHDCYTELFNYGGPGCGYHWGQQ